uniref:Uncharacterized protein n=1 Tax=Arundo donax TaxID=35708 RepID=A0A0A9HPZ3_ARUDO
MDNLLSIPYFYLSFNYSQLSRLQV